MYCDSKLSLQVGLTPETGGERVVSLSVLKLSMLGVDETSASVSMSGETLPVVSTLMSFGGSPGSGVLQSSWENLVLTLPYLLLPDQASCNPQKRSAAHFSKSYLPPDRDPQQRSSVVVTGLGAASK